jgi:hypothetical protein
MFVQSKSTTSVREKNGVAMRQRLGGRETLVQWQNGAQRWVETNDLQGEIRLVDLESSESLDDEQ